MNKCAKFHKDTVKSQIFVRYLISNFRTFEKRAKFNTGWWFIFVLTTKNKGRKKEARTLRVEDRAVEESWGVRKNTVATQQNNIFVLTPSNFNVILFEALESTKISSYEPVSSQKYENGYRTKICNFTVVQAIKKVKFNLPSAIELSETADFVYNFV